MSVLTFCNIETQLVKKKSINVQQFYNEVKASEETMLTELVDNVIVLKGKKKDHRELLFSVSSWQVLPVL